jgi:signal transduction histidine kinase
MARDKKRRGEKLKSPRRKAAPSRRSSEAKSRPARGRSGKSQQTRVTKLVREFGDALQRQSATAEILKVIASSRSDVQPVFDVIVQTSRELCRSQASTIFILREGKFHVVAFSGVQTELLQRMKDHPISIDQKGSALARAAREKRTIHIPNTLEDPEFVEGGPISVGGPRATLTVPLMRDGEVIGGITLRQPYLTPYTPRQIEAIETFASQAVIAIENARLFNEVQAKTRDLEESLQQQTATADVLKVISRSTFDLQTVLDTLLTSAARLCQADHSFIFLREGDAYRFAAGSGGVPEWIDYLKQQTIQPGRGTVAARAVLEARAIHIPDVLADPEYTFLEAQKRGGFRTALGVPLVREGISIGVMVLTRPDVRPFGDSHIALVTTFADQAVIAIENIRLFESVEARTRELSQSLDDLRAAQDRLVQTQKLASLGQLTAGIAHEIKNPLNFVNNFSGMSAELVGELQGILSGISIDPETHADIKELTDMLRANLEKIVLHGKRADAIVKSMLLHSGQSSAERRFTDINALVEECLNRAYYGERAETRGFTIKLIRLFDPAAGKVDLFPREIARALLNLISNGFFAATKRKEETKDSDYEPTIAAATKNLGDRVEIRIRDNGTGIPADVKEKMFDPFFTTRPAGEGTGLGLSISHDIIVKQHGGSIEVDTVPGEFAEICVILPRASALAPEGS